MRYRTLCGERTSLLGFGAMRLPTLSDGAIDEALVDKMVDEAIASGINYFDTAYPYHGGKSERVIGRSLSRYPREKYLLATKYPGHQLMSEHRPKEIFEEQLSKCGVEYFDFYLLHNVCESSINTYLDQNFGIIDYFIKQKEAGRIKHLGFSTHGRMDFLTDFLSKYGKEMEFCQIQLNYLDSTLQRADEKYELLTKLGIPVIVMEPVRGGKLSRLDEESERALSIIALGASVASFAFRYLLSYSNVSVILSGMSDLEQLRDNICTVSSAAKLSEEEEKILASAAEKMKNSVPCTSCKYCTDVCPQNLDIPTFMATYNELSSGGGVNSAMTVQFLPEDKKPEMCIGCGACSAICPQSISIPKTIEKLVDMLSRVPSWAKICEEREKAAMELKKQI